MRSYLVGILITGSAVLSAPVFMDAEWARAFCEVWNNTPDLVNRLGNSDSWNSVPERKIFLYRKDCGKDKTVQLTIRNEEGRAMCVYGGWAKDERGKDDFLMFADTKRWIEMGQKRYGPMRAMMFGRLKFKGPKGVAMRNMSPFEAFLDAIDEVESDTSRCP
ncbi:MAG: SCP2 sterol-binding domain-containing protein [Aquificota bacterium]|nr:SCP2 sterol-binding domain-containing protein [Aquificota bacterium]